MDSFKFEGITQLKRCMEYGNGKVFNFHWNFRFDRTLGDKVKEVNLAFCKENIYISGPLGKLKLSWKSLGIKSFTDKGLLIFNNKAKFGTFIGLLRRSIFGVIHGFRKELELRGLGFRGFIGEDGLYLDLGDCHWIVCPIPEEIKVKFQGRYHLLLCSSDYIVLNDFLVKLERLRKVNIYTGMGLRVADKTYRVKVGKVKER